MIILGSYAILRPYWLLIIPALIIVLSVTKSKASSLGDWPRAIDAPLLAALLERQGVQHQLRKNLALYWSLGLIALALSGPATRFSERGQFRNLDVVLIVMDVSRAENIPQVVSSAQIILSDNGARQIGLILYAGDAYLASPLTDDVSALEGLIFAVDERTVPEGGRRPEKALALARRILQGAQSFSGDVVLISDGDGVTSLAQDQASALSHDGHKLHTIAVSSHNTVSSQVRHANLQQLARDGNGMMKDAVRAGEIATAIAKRGIDHLMRDPRTALEWSDHGRYILLLAAGVLLLCFRRGAL